MTLQTAFGPQGPNYSTTRPPADPKASAGVDTWFRNCTAAGAKDGTFATADFFNVLVANLRYLVRTSGVGLDDGDDTMVYQAVRSLGKPFYAVDEGTPNHIVVELDGVQALTPGMLVLVKIAAANTGATVITVNSLGETTVTLGNGSTLTGGEVQARQLALLAYDGTAFQLISAAGNQTKKLAASAVVYVNGSTGSDTLYDGSSATVSGGAGPFATIQRAIDFAAGYTSGPFAVSVNVATWGSNYAGFRTPSYPIPPIVINGGSSSGTIIDGADSVAAYALGLNTVTLQNCRVQANPGGFCTRAEDGAHLKIGTNVVFGSGGAALNAIHGGIASVLSSTTFAGTSYGSGVLFSQAQGAIVVDFATLVLANAMSSPAFAVANDGGTISAWHTLFTNPGNFTGQRYNASGNGVIETVGGGANFFPGTSAGSVVSGGQYA